VERTWTPIAVLASEARIEETREYRRRDARSLKNVFQSSRALSFVFEDSDPAEVELVRMLHPTFRVTMVISGRPEQDWDDFRRSGDA
jgi:hypothetical protein